MAAAPRVRPEDFFSADEWRSLSARSSWRGLALVVHCWATIGAAIAIGTAWPITIPLMVMVVGTRQLGLFVLMHDGAHGALHPNRRVNDLVAHWLCSPALRDYRPYHLQHHRFVQQAEDPDLVLSAPFPISRKSLARKMLRDLTGQTFFKQRISPLLQSGRERFADRRKGADAADGAGASTARAASQELARGGRFVVANGIGFAVFAVAGYGWAWLALWLLPMVVWLPLISRIRNIAEHALIDKDQADPWRQARTTQANLLERAFLAPYGVNYHVEHHLFTQLPCWQLPRAHRLLRERGLGTRMETESGYFSLLRRAAPA